LGIVQEQDPSKALGSPERAAQSSEALTFPEVEQLIPGGFRSDPELAGASVSVRTDDRAIVLMGTVTSERQHDISLRIVQSFAGKRQIVDKIKIIVPSSE
jgi:hypothetical protein